VSNQTVLLNINALQNLARLGDRATEEQLFQRLTESFRVFVQQRIQSQEDGEEIVQEALITIAEKYREIDFTTSFAAWAYRVLENKLLDYYRTKQRRESRITTRADGDATGSSWNPDPEFKRRLLNCLQSVAAANHRHAQILHLHYQGYSAAEVCAKLSLTKNAAYILLSRARAMLKSCLEEGGFKP